MVSEYERLITSDAFLNAKKTLLDTIQEASQKVSHIKPPAADATVRDDFLRTLDQYAKDRGRELTYPFLASGLGFGPYVELVDGSVKLDMITGIGINFFGHTHRELMDAMVDGLSSDVMQGNLEPGLEAQQFLRTILSKVENSRLRHGWMIGSGTMANEIALKMTRQKKAPATKILGFKNSFAGRSTAMQEVTDNPKYREGQPTYNEVRFLPHYQPEKGLEKSITETLEAMKGFLDAEPGCFAALSIELVQGEGGFNFGPREWYVRVFEEAKKAGLAIWVDEVQTFGRTEELFAFQTFGLEAYVDVVTFGKLSQDCGVLFTPEYNPKPGLVAGTFCGATSAIRAGRRGVEILCSQGFFGKAGKIHQLSEKFRKHLDAMAEESLKGVVGERRIIGGMIGFQVFSGSMDDTKAVIMRLFDQGMVAFSCGRGPYFIRFLPPLAAMNEKDVDFTCEFLEKVLKDMAQERKA